MAYEPENENDNQHETENATKSTMSVAVTMIAATGKQKNQQYNEKDGQHGPSPNVSTELNLATIAYVARTRASQSPSSTEASARTGTKRRSVNLRNN